MKTINRDKIQRMVGDRYGGGGSRGESADLDGYASQIWVNQNFVSKKFFARLFTINGTDENDDAVVVEPNDLDTDITDIQLMFGAWTEHYLSALGIGSGGSGGSGILTEPLASINGMGNPSGSNKVLCWDGSRWTYKNYSSGSVASVGMTVPDGFKVSNNTSQTITTSGTFALSFGGTVTKNRVLASPAAADGAPSWRELVAADIPDLSATYLSQTALASYKWWGRTLQTSGQTKAVSGDMTSVGDITMNAGYPRKLNFGDNYEIKKVNGYFVVKVNNYELYNFKTDKFYSTVQIHSTASVLADTYVKTPKLYLYKPNSDDTGAVYLEYDSVNGGVHIVNAGIYADKYSSALGAGSGGTTV